jgi:hypothetical protein
MMDKISQTLGTATGVEIPNSIDNEMALATTNEVVAVTDKFKEMRSNLDQDYDFARGNLRKVLEQAMSLLPNAISLAREAESPRIYESTSAFIKTIADINKDLLEITERNLKQAPSAGKNISQPESNVTNNAIFVGTTEDLFTKLVQSGNIIDNQSGNIIDS